jgi:hypothetical protein
VKKRAFKKNWIKGALRRSRRGALHRALGVPAEYKIPKKMLKQATQAGGGAGRMARLALTLRGFHRPR